MSIKIALAGNPNCGKTTLFNALTGANQYVGNWPGVTVEKKEGRLKNDKEIIVVDLPGIYSLSPYTLEEVVTRDYILGEGPDVLLNLVDATNLERNLYLTTQLLEAGIPTVVALNMFDVVQKNGDYIDTNALSKALGCPVVETSALRGTGLDEAVNQALAAANAGRAPSIYAAFPTAVEQTLNDLAVLIHGVRPAQARWYAVKLFERDEKLALTLSPEEAQQVETLIASCEQVMDDDAESIITNGRYDHITSIIKNCLSKKRVGMTVSDHIDRVVTNRFLALPIFVLVMGLVYYLAITSLGTIVTDFTNDVLFGTWIQPGLTTLLAGAGASGWLISLVVDGIIGGIAAPIGFAPQMAILFLFLSLLEGCGYMARVAFIMDRVFRRFGLSGKSFIPLMVSSGCGVPGIMATKAIESEHDRRMTMTTATFIPCGAKLPVIALIAGYIFNSAWWVSWIMYFIGIAAVVVSGVILKKTKPFRGDPAPFVMELPQYHLPAGKNVAINVWERVWSFLKKAGTVLFVCCAVMWFLAAFGNAGGTFGYLGEIEGGKSLLEYIGSAIAPLFAPLGFGTWEAVSAALSGFVAKEGIVSTMGVIVGLGEESAQLGAAVFTTFFGGSALAAFSFLLFNMLDSPCLAAISTLAREMKSSKWTAFAVIFQNVFAYAVCLVVFQLGTFFMGGIFTLWTGVAFAVLALFLLALFRPAPTRRRREPAVSPVGAGV